VSSSPSDYQCRECGALVLYRSDHKPGCVHHPDTEPEVHQLATATPTTATCACGTVAVSAEPLQAIDLIETHITEKGGRPL
jgi:hypothetical protein